METLRIELFGHFRVTVGDRAVPDGAWSQRRPAALVKLLALAPGHRLRRDQVMDVLWPELDPAAAGRNLRKALHAARRALDGEQGADLIASVGDLLCLPSDRLSVDVDEYRSAAATARRTRAVDAHAGAIELYRDGLLPEDVYEDWAVAPRDALRDDWLALMAEFAELLETRGDLNDAARTVQRLVAADPLSEDNHAWLMRLYSAAGRRGEARRQYQRLCDVLDAELGIEPSPSTQRLYEEIRSNLAAEPEQAIEVWERVGDLRAQSGDAAATITAYERALRAGPDAATAIRLHRKGAAALVMQQQLDAAETHLDAADRLGPDAVDQGRLAGVRAGVMRERGDFAAARRLADRAHQVAVAHGDADAVAEALEEQAILAHIQGTWRTALQVQMPRLAAVDLGGRVSRFFEINHCIGQYQLYEDALADDVEQYARETLALAERADAVAVQAFAWCLLGESLLLRGHWDAAAACLDRSCELYAPMGSRSVALPWLRRAELAICTGALDEVVPYLKRASAIAAVTPLARHAWGRLHATAALAALERDDLDGAVESVRAASRTAARYGDCASCGLLLNPVGAETLARAGDAAGARAFAEAARRAASFHDSMAWTAMAESAAGSAAAAAGDPVEARAGFETAAALYEKAGQPFWAARSRRQAAAV
ncbi:DNA-binding transcriptional activator of the SARP family [Frankia torreyi]|uniref:DNA-binding transcriptional activator of the SARP family n=1 Tax=Frankia torreyi TaxID=1856 RepID=A0A0D8BCA4_9ACTN|nr:MULTISPECIES: BTAD domain-containing putative transcriptional regulator [Frankia]KJE21022.1 DNA-binding transcriptional activator of the SARP family [Frankia torreyi]KQC35929.1 transcriptional regulator [Frankia sp. ACN1ag]